MSEIMKDHFAVVVKNENKFDVVFRSLDKGRATNDYLSRKANDPNNVYFLMSYHEGKYTQIEMN